MKRILCYGDSNTWGYIPVTGERYDESTRWTAVMAGLLGDDYCVIEAGLNGRTTAFDDPLGDYRNGAKLILPCLLTHKPVDLVIVMLGTNDTKMYYHTNAFAISKGLERIIWQIRTSECGRDAQLAKILVAAPIEVGEGITSQQDMSNFDEKSVEISRQLPAHYARVADWFNCDFINASEYAQPSGKDDIHLSEDGHNRLAHAFADKVRDIFR